MITQYSPLKIFLLLLVGVCLVASIPAQAQKETDTPELTAVFLVGGIYPGTALSIDLMHISEVEPATYPTEEELIEIVYQFYDNYWSPYYNHRPGALIGNFQLFIAEPGDFGAVTIVDIRDGRVVFASQMVWMGFGETEFPVTSTHDWVWEDGLPASEPTAVDIIPNFSWSDEYFGSQEYLTQVSLDHLRQTDVVRSFGASAPYQATSYIHTPTIGMTDPTVALHVVILSGHAGPPWGPDPVATTPTSWDMVKSVYR